MMPVGLDVSRWSNVLMVFCAMSSKFMKNEKKSIVVTLSFFYESSIVGVCLLIVHFSSVRCKSFQNDVKEPVVVREKEKID